MQLSNQDLITMIARAFGHRVIPEKCLSGPIPGDDDPLYSPGVTQHIEKHIAGRSWQDVPLKDFEFVILYLSPEAFCYYLPKVLIGSLADGECFEELGVYVAKSFARDKIAPFLTSDEQHVIALYTEAMASACWIYSASNIEFWHTISGQSRDVGA